MADPPHLHRLRVIAAHLGGGQVTRPLAAGWGSPTDHHERLRPARTRADASVSGGASSSSMHRPAVMTAAEAVADIKDGSMLVVSGFVGVSHPEALVDAVRARFDATATPRRLGLLVVAAVGDGKGRGLGRLAVPGLLARLIYAWTGLSPEFAAMIAAAPASGLEAHNLPLGVVSHMIRDVAAGRPGPTTRVGVGTFVDPAEGGGKRTPGARDLVTRVTLPGGSGGKGSEAYLHYAAPDRVDVALLRGSVADADGNVACGGEALPHLDFFYQAAAAKNSGGVVVVQVGRLVPPGSLPPRSVTIPGCLVDRLVVVGPEHPAQALAIGGVAGLPPAAVAALRAGGGGGGGGASPPPATPPTPADHHLPTGVRRIVAHRALLALGALCRPRALVNIGVGMPEGTASLVPVVGPRDIPASLPLTLSTEAGAIGGTPAGGRLFGASVLPAAFTCTAAMLDLYNGGALDAAVLGMAEVNGAGDVNVSCFPGRTPGCGGFIDISQSARAVIFVGTFTSGGLAVAVDGLGGGGGGGGGGSGGGPPRLRIVREGWHRKFRAAVVEKTFAGSSGGGRPILYVTERAVFRLVQADGGGGGGGGGGTALELVELAPGVDLRRDVLGQMDFEPRVSRPLGVMDARCFAWAAEATVAPPEPAAVAVPGGGAGVLVGA